VDDFLGLHIATDPGIATCLFAIWMILDDLSGPLFIICSSYVRWLSVVHRLFLGGTPETMSSALVAGSASIDASALQLGCPPQVAENVLDRHVLTDD
jgi:hypothetical protein